MFDSEDAITRIDMSEYMEKHAVSRLIGAPPGYVGYDEGGQLTEAVRRRPYAVILLDEIEKAHPDVFNVLLQILDDGRLTDGKGRTVDFTNTVLIMTSNVGSRRSPAERIDENDPGEDPGVLTATFKPEFLNRIDETVIFHRLSREDITRIVDVQVAMLTERVRERGIEIELTDDARTLLGNLGYDPTYGARPLKRVIQKQLVDRLALKLLEGEFSRGRRRSGSTPRAASWRSSKAASPPPRPPETRPDPRRSAAPGQRRDARAGGDLATVDVAAGQRDDEDLGRGGRCAAIVLGVSAQSGRRRRRGPRPPIPAAARVASETVRLWYQLEIEARASTDGRPRGRAGDVRAGASSRERGSSGREVAVEVDAMRVFRAGGRRRRGDHVGRPRVLEATDGSGETGPGPCLVAGDLDRLVGLRPGAAAITRAAAVAVPSAMPSCPPTRMKPEEDRTTSSPRPPATSLRRIAGKAAAATPG